MVSARLLTGQENKQVEEPVNKHWPFLNKIKMLLTEHANVMHNHLKVMSSLRLSKRMNSHSGTYKQTSSY